MPTRWIIPALMLLAPAAEAGMPSFSLREVTQLRLEVISFFLLMLLASAGLVRWIWNLLRKDFPRMPLMSYPRACGMIVLWGFLFVLILTMISGARELMTPGAWDKQGATYKLKQGSK